MNSNVKISWDLLEEAILKLKTGKAAGHDGLVCEHITNAHPILVVIIKKLFNLMLQYEYVPDGFGIVIMIPILKASVNNKSHSTDHYRGISINQIISKLFEMRLLSIFNTHLVSSKRKFGFKSKYIVVLMLCIALVSLLNILYSEVPLLTYVQLTCRKLSRKWINMHYF